MAAEVAGTRKLGWHFPTTFWVANVAELFERAAYYGMFIALVVYLTDKVGFSDVAAGVVAGVFGSWLYLLPTFAGIMADRIGFRRALILAFALLTGGYFLLGILQLKATVLAALALIMAGGAIVKPVISGTVAKCSDDDHRARAFSIFYAMVNIGAFTGKFVAAPLRTRLGLEYINFYAAGMALLGLLVVALFYREVDRAGAGRTYRQALAGLAHVLRDARFLALILIVGGFWAIQHQLYASMPKYILRLLGPQAKPEWLANINPAVVVLLVLPITHLVRNFKPVNSIAISLAIIPLTALSIALSAVVNAWSGGVVDLGLCRVHPLTLMVVIGIGLQGLAECFLSPKWLEFASKQAPPGEVGLYMGYAHLTSVFAYLFGFILAGLMLDRYCPDPTTLEEAVRAEYDAALATGGTLPAVYAHAHYIWYFFTGLGVAAFAALLVFKAVTERLDRRRAHQGAAAIP